MSTTRDATIKTAIDISAKIDSFQSAVKNIQNSLNQLHLNADLKGEFSELFSNFDKEFKNIKDRTKNNQLRLIDEKSTRESFTKIEKFYDDLKEKLKENGVKTSILEKDAALINKLTVAAKKYSDSLDNSDEIKKVTSALEKEKRELDEIIKRQSKLNNTVTNQEESVESLKAQLKATKELTSKDEERRKKWEELVAAQRKVEEAANKAKAAQYEKSGTSTRGWNNNSEYIAALKAERQAQEDATRAQQEYENVAKQTSATVDTAAAEQERLEKALARAQQSLTDNKVRLEQQNEKYRESTEAIKQFENQLSNLKSDAFEKIKSDIDSIDWTKFGFKKAPIINSFDDLNKVIEETREKSEKAAVELLKNLKPSLEKAGAAGKNANQAFNESATGLKKLKATATDIERLTGRLVQFFSIDNAVRLFRRAIHSAAETVKELDKVMTETAVVTDFSIGDMWKQLPDYTKRANELGLAVKDVYEASTLYYQQGLNTNEVMAVTNATLRMARIASLDAADATDRMTNALRGFNMEINEANADNIADVYSKLAAISASDVDEISTAMTKVASLASSANMQFENTAAFLAQIIETTRESAETAGTALKTVIARFSEVKDLYSKGELLGTDEEGEEIDVNKVSKALRTAGINLNEFLTGQRGLDEIFIELASKWDQLDIVQQRYIATMAAGSRQQSRFIALMSDYQRTQELTSAAENAAGASMEQYNKTLESVQTKLNRLKNAWNEFLMGIANDKAIRFVLDTLINFLNGINKVTDSISGGKGLIKSIASLGIAIGGLKVGGNIIKKIFGDPSAHIKGLVQEIITGIKSPKQSHTLYGVGQQWGSALVDGMSSTFDNVKHLFARTFKKKLTFEDLGIDKAEVTDIINSHDTGKVAELFNLSSGKTKYLDSLNQRLKEGQIFQKDYEAGLKRIGVTSEKTFENQQQALNTTRIACLGLGAAFTTVGTILEKTQGKSNKAAKAFKTIGTALMSVGAILPVLSGAFQVFGISVTKTILGIPIIGWIAAVITAVITLITFLTDAIETPAEVAENAKKALDEATEAAEKTTNKLNELIDAQTKLAETKDKFEGLTRGTEAWSKAIEENNAQVLELLSNYKELEVVNKDGILTITNMDKAIEAQNQRNRSARVGEIGAQINSVEAQVDSYVETVSKEIGTNLSQFFVSRVLSGIANQRITSLEQIEIEYNKELKRNNNQVEAVGRLADNLSFEDWQRYAQSITSMYHEIDNFERALGAEASSLADLTEEQQKYIGTVSNLDKTIDNLDIALFQSYSSDHSKWTSQQNVEYDEWAKMRYGSTAKTLENGDVITDDGTVLFDTARSEFLNQKIVNELTKEIEKTTQGLISLSKGNTQAKAAARAFEEGGTLLNLADLQAIVGSDVNPFDLTSTDAFRTYAEQIYNKNGGEALGNKEDFIRNLSEAFFTALTNYRNAGVSDTSSLSGVSASVIGAFNDKFEDYIQNILSFDNIINSKLNDMGITEAGDITKILNTLTGTDLSSRRDIESVTGILETMGLDVASEEWNNFINFIIERTGALDEIDLTHFKENLDSIKKTISDLRSGEHNNIFTDEEYAAIRPYVNDEDFQETAYGVIYVGDDFESLGDKIQQAISDGFEETSRILENKINLVDVYEQASSEAVRQARVSARNLYEQLGLSSRGVSFDQFYTSRENEYTARETLKNVLRAYGEDIKYLQIPGLVDLAKNGGVENLKLEEVENYLKLIQAEVAKQTENESQQASLEISKRIEGGIQKLIDQWQGNNYDTTAFAQLIEQLDLPKQIANSLTQGLQDLNAQEIGSRYRAAEELKIREKEGLNLDELTAFANALENTKDLAIDTSIAVAAANTKLNTGLKSIIDSYETVNELIENGPLGKDQPLVFTNSEEFKKFDTLKKDLQIALDLHGDLSDSFFESAENMELLRQVANGTVEEQEIAFEKLQKAAAFDLVANVDFGEAQEEVDGFLDTLRNLEIPDLEVGAVLKDGPFRAALDGLAKISKEAAQAIGSALGLKQSYVKIGSQDIYVPSDPNENDIGGGAKELGLEMGLKKVSAPIYELQWVSTGSGKTDFSGLDKNRDDNGSKTSKSGSGSSSKPKQWKNPYDELYNLQEKINSALRERERLEHRYQDMLKDHTKVAQDLTKNSYEEIASLKKQLALQNQMLSGRQKQMKKVLSETYEDSEGNRRTYSSMGVQKYGWYEAKTQTVHIEWDKINQVTDENLGGAIEAYISRLEEIRDKIQDTEDAIEDAKDQLLEIVERGKEEYIDFEQQIYDALINQQQKNIETLENINSSIKEAADKTINAIQDEIEKERQARENEKAQEDIYDKEMRLAYLQRDTSGANALEIQKLQEEIQNDQLSYQDKIIDQTIQEMQDEAARAEEQRQAEIDLLNAQLEWDQEHGFYWSQVEALIQSGMNSDGSLKLDSELDQLLKDTEGPLSKFGDIKWKQDLARQIASAMQGRANWEMSVAKEAGEMTLANGTKLSYNAKNDKWYDSKGKEYTNFNWNSEADAFTASKVKTSSTSSTTSTSSSKSASSSDSSVKAYTVRDGDSLWTIAAREYGDGNKAYDIARYNNIGNADMIYTGQVLKLPKKFAKGGLADFTGPAWLDGSKSHPEMVLNAADTQNLITLKNVLAAILQNDTNAAKNSSGNNYFDINIQADIDSDYDVDRLADRIKKQIYDDASYRNVNAISYIR